ncbi:MAG: hypothetical protein AB1Z23_01450 [Eubacteriales bacterium]
MRVFRNKNIIFFIIIILLLAGCTNKDKIDSTATSAPVATDVPFLSNEIIISGGDGLTHQNLADIQIENLENDKVRMTLSFMTGSGAAMIDQRVSSGVPNYSVSHVEGVDRMMIQLDGISNWTYKIYDEEIQNNSIIQGVLKQEPIDGNSLYLYVSTKDDYSYRVDTNTNKIVITMYPHEQSTKYNYYIKLNAFLEYQNGYFKSEDFYPCLSRDGVNGVLLSYPFDTLDAANLYLDEHKEELEAEIDIQDISVVYLANNELPEYSYENQLEQIINKPIGYRSDESIVGLPLITDGRFLTWGKTKDDFVYARAYTLLGSQVGDVYSYEEIWKRQKDSSARMMETQFNSVLNADYSYDNRFLAFIDQNDETRMLQILDNLTGDIYLPADDGFGIDTSSFVWSNNDNRLFAITGERESKQLLCYDMRNILDISVYALTEEEYMESSLCLFDEYIYFLKAGEDSLTTDIYRADIETGHASKFLSGNSFMLSPKGNKIAVNDMQQKNAEQYSFYLYDMNTKNKEVIQTGKMIMDYTWSRDGSRIYYTVYKNAGWEDEYPLQLYYYDVAKNKSYYVMDMITGALYPAYDEDQVLVMSIFQLQDRQITITYQVQ